MEPIEQRSDIRTHRIPAPPERVWAAISDPLQRLAAEVAR